MKEKAHVLRRVFPVTVPVLAGYIFLGIAYGMAMKARGFGIEWSFPISTFVYAGSLEFAMIEPLCGAFTPLTFAFLCLLIQARHLFYGLTMLEPYSRAGRFKPYLIFSLTDETYSIVCQGAPKDIAPEKWYTAVSGLNHFYWVTGSVLGAVLGSAIPLEMLEGINYSMTALFLVIMTEQTVDAVAAWKEGRSTLGNVLFAPLVGTCGTLLCLLLFGKESFLLFAMFLILAAFAEGYHLMEGK